MPRQLDRKARATTKAPDSDWKSGIYKPIIEGAKTEVKRRAVVAMRDALAGAIMKTIS
jgi:hypothetical protein